VLLRAGRVTVGEELARGRRGFDPGRAPRDLARGPARLCQALAIDRAQNGADLCDPASELRMRPGGVDARDLDDARGLAEKRPQIDVGPRVGVSKAADIPWRFWLAQDPTVSVYRPSVPRSSRREAARVPSPVRVPRGPDS
jgi:DNA-3-methyladenine glycosylase